jgi:hypothetical protein
MANLAMSMSVEIGSKNRRSILKNSFSTYPIRIIAQEEWQSYVTFSMERMKGTMNIGENTSMDIKSENNSAAW